MDCAGVEERLPGLLAGNLQAAEADEVRAHLRTCPRCPGELEETRRAAETALRATLLEALERLEG